MKKEPALIISSVISLIEASIACAVGFGLNWTTEQFGLVMSVVSMAGGVVTAILIRRKVTPYKQTTNV